MNERTVNRSLPSCVKMFDKKKKLIINLISTSLSHSLVALPIVFFLKLGLLIKLSESVKNAHKHSHTQNDRGGGVVGVGGEQKNRDRQIIAQSRDLSRGFP